MRTARHHWTDLSLLLADFERCFEACARLDAYRGSTAVGPDHEGVQSVEWRLTTLRARVDREITRITVERLQSALAKKQVAVA